MEYVSVSKLADIWGISPRRLEILCAENRVHGVVRIGRTWAVPANAKKPKDARIKDGKYRKTVKDTEKECCNVSIDKGGEMADFVKLIQELRKYPNETQWLEFKHNNYTPDMIGRDISALANSAALLDRPYAYMVWGIDDSTHEIVGTDYDLSSLRKGSQELENWLRSLLSDNAYFEFYSVPVDDRNVGLLIVHRAANLPVSFEKTEYIRIGSYTKKLNEYPSIQAQLWDKINNLKFEERCAMKDLGLDEALRLLDYTIYFDILRIPQPSTIEEIAHYLLEESILRKQDNGLYEITNLGAVLFAKKLSDFPKIARKAVRIVQYSDNSRYSMLKEYTSEKGYVTGFDETLNYIEALTPSEEVIDGAKREKKTAFPEIAIRECVANALIHQDFSVSGTGPVVEIFKNRIEITNPGAPLIDVFRIIDNPPHSRNEQLASIMRRLRLCEELGTGWDKIIISCELMQLPAPKIETFKDSTRVTLYSEKPFSSLTAEEKLWACYLHACIRHVQGEQLTNASLRTRFGLRASSSGTISRLIKDAVEKKLIKPLCEKTAPRYMSYIPIWG